MRILRAFAIYLCAAFAAGSGLTDWAAATDQFPYTVYANSEDVYVRSGPGKNYYPTAKLNRGDALEVYRQDPGGWLAIRPPEGSFSWVESDALKPVGEHIAIVVKDRAMCYVGTKFSSAHDVHQVRLDKGEQVEILDMKQVGEGADAQTWCEISPPSGEFRWVFGKLVDRQPPTGVSSPAVEGDRKPDAARKAAAAAFDRDSSTSRDPKGSDWRSAQAGSGSQGPVAGGQSADWKSTTNAHRPTDDQTAAPGDPFQTDLNEIDFEVSKMAADGQTTWEFTALRRRAEAMLPRAETALERGKVRLILNRIARFEDVKRRNEMIAQSPGAIPISTQPTSSLAAQPPQYDGIGKLTPVVSQRPNAPQYALVDKTNQVVSFITPAPGVNLQPYVGQEVGVSGQRGFMPELKKPHVTAMRVNVLDDAPVLR
jgi:SH3-like domain-containing protein